MMGKPAEIPGTGEAGSDAGINIKKLQLYWLLQITKAINYNLPAEELFRIYEQVMRDQLKVRRLVFFVKEKKWSKILSYGVPDDFLSGDPDSRFGELNELQFNNVHMPSWVQGFDSIIPVFHDGHALAYAFIGDLQHDEVEHLKEILPFIHTVTNIIVVAIENKRLTRESILQAQMQRELELAAEMQAMLFPDVLPENGDFDLAATSIPHQQVGGDYYDYVKLNEDEYLVCLADVSGKGVSAALLMSNFQANLQARAAHFGSLGELAEDLNRLVNRTAKGERFITAFLGIINIRTLRLSFVNAGHNPPLLHHEGRFTFLETGTTGLGMFPELPFIHQDSIDVPPGAVLLCYTDGIVEQENEEGEPYGVNGLMRFLESSRFSEMKSLNEKLLDDFENFRSTAQPLDDVTLLSFRFRSKA